MKFSYTGLKAQNRVSSPFNSTKNRNLFSLLVTFVVLFTFAYSSLASNLITIPLNLYPYNTEIYDYERMNMLPTNVRGYGFDNIHEALSQDLGESASFTAFRNAQATKLRPITDETVEVKIESPDSIVPSDQMIEAEQDDTESQSSDLGSGPDPIPTPDSESPIQSQPDEEITEPPQTVSEPIEEISEPPVIDSTPPTESEPISLYRYFETTYASLPLLQESLIETTDTQQSVSEITTEPVASDVVSESDLLEVTTEVLSPIQEVGPDTPAAPLEVPTDTILPLISDTSDPLEVSGTPIPQNADDATLLSTMCIDTMCPTHALEFSGFGVPDNMDDYRISNMQLRLSMGVKPTAHNDGTPDEIRVEYFHDGFWMDGGIVVLDEETSNEQNGGYFLFAFPLYSEWEQMNNIKVRFTLMSDSPDHVPELYIDATWLELEYIHNNAIIDPDAMPTNPNLDRDALPDVRKDAPDGYSVVFNALDTEFENSEVPSFTFDVNKQEKQKSFFERVTHRVKSFLGFSTTDTSKSKLNVRIINDDFRGYIKLDVGEDGSYALSIPRIREFKPGKHTLTLEVTDGDTVFYIDQEFTWGVLALNTDQSVYTEGERSYIQMGVLDDLGHTICDAQLALRVTAPNGEVTHLKTDDGTIEYGEECAGDTYTTSPDYDAYYTFASGIGGYHFELIAETENGTHRIDEVITVESDVPYVVTRTGPTRIYPPAPYPVSITVLAHDDYEGLVIERVPLSFQVFDVDGSGFRTREVGDAKELSWDVSLKKGEKRTFTYSFDAPDISPEFYLLGPLQIGAWNEYRSWQIASDAPGNARIIQTVLGTEANATSYSATLGSAPSAGNTIIMVAMHRDGASAFTAPAFLSQAVLSNAGVEIDIGIWYGNADPATSTYSISKTGGNQTGIVYLMEVAGLSTTTPIVATSSNDQTGATGLIANTGVTGTSTQYAFAVSGIAFGDNDFTTATSGSWNSSSTATYTQDAWTQWATGNDAAFGVAYAHIRQAARQGARLTLLVGGAEERNSVLAVFRVADQIITTSARGNQRDEIKINATSTEVGGVFTITPSSGSSTITSITISEAGTTDGQVDLSNIRLKYEMDAVAPYDCASATYDGTELQYGATSSAFSSANGTSTFTGSVDVSTTSVMCIFTVLDVDSSATAGHTIELQITNPSTQIVAGTGSSTPNSVVSISNTTVIVIGFVPSAPVLNATTTFPFMRSTTTQPTFGGFYATDTDNDLLEYEFSIDDDPLFGSPATTTYSSNFPNDAGWASTTFRQGTSTSYRIQEQLTSGTTYWWRVRARDPFNRNTWSGYSPIRSITISDAITTQEWFQTTDYQFSTSSTLSNATTTGTGGVEAVDLDTSVTLLDAWSTGNTKTVSSGSNRMLIITVASEDTGTDVNVGTVTYGNSLVTEIYDNQIGAGAANGLWVGYLDDAGIASSTNTTISVTWTGSGTPTPNNGIIYSSAVFAGVDQTNPIRNYSPNALTTGTTINPASSLSVTDGDVAFYAVTVGATRTFTPEAGYTEGTDSSAGCGGGCSLTTAYKDITADGTENPTATLSASGNRVLMTAAILRPTPGQGTITSPEIDFDWVLGQSDWGEISWTTTETATQDTFMQLYYSSTTACDTIVPNSALPGNSTGFISTSSPKNISSLSTTTYNRICLRMTLSEGYGTTSPTLDDWTVSWDLSPVFDQTIYKWYVNSNSSTPHDSWPQGTTTGELSFNEPIIASEPTETDEVLRLRIGVTASSVPASGKTFALQYAEGDTCASPSLEWKKVGAIGSTTARFRGYDNSGISDGATVGSSTLTSTDVLMTYEEENNSSVMPSTITAGNQGEWDWVIEHHASSGVSYCFRMTESDGTPFASYTNYPLLITNDSPTIITVDTPFDNQQLGSTTPWFEFTATDPEGDNVDYQIQIDNNSDFSSPVIDTESESNLTDFENIPNPSNKSPFYDGESIRYIVSSALSANTTYWWRVRSVDTNDSQQYGDWITARSFTVASTTITTWFQTTEAQFDTDTLEGTDATGGNLVQFASGSTTGTTTSSMIDYDDVVTGNAWGEFSFTETGAANNILYHIEYYNGSSWVLVPDSDLSGNAAGFDTSPVSLLDLDTSTYNQIRIRANFLSGSPTLLDWTVEWGERVSVVTHLLLFDNEMTGTTTPTFTFYSTDPEGDSLEYQFSYATDSTFTVGTTTVNSNSAPGFQNVSDVGDLDPFDSGEVIQYKIQTALATNTTYWWRVRAKDPGGSDSYSFWSDPWSFTPSTTATTSTWFQTTKEQFDTNTLTSLNASSTGFVSTVPASTTVYNFSGITFPSATHVARDFEVDVADPTDPPAVDEIDSLTTNGFASGTPNLRTAILGYASDAEATTTQYAELASSDNVHMRITDPGAGDNAVFWTRFDINEEAADIAQIDILVEGYQAVAVDKAWLGVWRPGSTTPYWQRLSDSTQTSDFNYTGTINSNISQYLDGSGYLYIMFFNEDDSDSLFIDYMSVTVTSNAADSGIMTGSSLDFDDGSGPAWGNFSWGETKPGSSAITYQLQYLTGAGTWALIPDTDLTGNAAGFTSGPVNLKFLNTTTYNEIRPIANLTCDGINCPRVNDWKITWSPGFTISGTAYEYDGVSSTTSGTVAVAVDGVLQTGKTGTISNGSWSISNVSYFASDTISVFVNGANDEDEALGVTVYDGTPDITGMQLRKRFITIGSDDYATVTNSHIELYDYTDNTTDIFHDVSAGNDLTLCADTGCGDASILILPSNTYSPGSGADVTTHDFITRGTLIAGSNTLRSSGSWYNTATTTMTGSTLIMTATSTSEVINTVNSIVSNFNSLTFGEGSSTATWTMQSDLDIDGSLSVNFGTFARGTTSIAIAGNLTTGASGTWNGVGTTTFDGTNPSTWSDNNATKQNIGRVLIDGTSKTTVLGTNTFMQSLVIGANDTFDAGSSGFSTSLYENWINNNTFTPRTGTVTFLSTTTNRTITQGGDAFYNLTFSGVGGSWAFTEADLVVNNNFTVSTGTVTLPTGTTTISGSFSSVGGTFAHNNALVNFAGSGTHTIAASGTAFTNAFYNLRFGGTGTYTFLDTISTTTNNFLLISGTTNLPTGVVNIGGSFTQSGGTFNHSSGIVRLAGSGSNTIDITSSSFFGIIMGGVGTYTFIDTNVTVLDDILVATGTLVLPSGTLTLGGSLTNQATTSHASGTVLFNSTDTGEVIALGNSSLYNMTFLSSTGGWTITQPATTTNNFTLSSSSVFALSSSQTLAVLGTFTNTVGGGSTTWSGSTLSLEAGSYTINTKVLGGDAYDTIRVKANTDIKIWNSSSTNYDIDTTGSLYSQDHSGADGDLYIYGNYERTSGNEYWSYATDFDGTSLSGGSERQVDVRIATSGVVSITGSLFEVIGGQAASTTVDATGLGTYTVFATTSTTTFNYYSFDALGLSGVTLAGSGRVSSLSYGTYEPFVGSGTGLSVSSILLNANPQLQLYGVGFSTTSVISATNVTQFGTTSPSTYWWFRESTGNIDGEFFDADTGDPGSIRWDDSSLLITASGTVYSDAGITPMGSPTCDGVTPVVRVVVQGGASYTGSCNLGTGTFSIPSIAIVGDPVLTIYLDTNGGTRGVVVTRTPTEDITDLNIYQNRIITRHEDIAPLTIINMSAYDSDNDTDIPYTAATGTLTVFRDTELRIGSSTTFVPAGDITIHGNASSSIVDGSFYIDQNGIFTGSGTSTYTLAGSFTLGTGGTFTSASTSVVMNATTTGKTITTGTSSQEIIFAGLSFTGTGGGWNINSNIRSLSGISVSTGTVSGTGDITVVNGSLSGNGTVSMGSGTTTIHNTNTLGGTNPWTFSNLTLGNGSANGTTTPGSSATTTVGSVFTIRAGHTLDAGSSIFDLRGTGNVFVESGTFLEDTSTVRYSGILGSNILSTTYYNLDVKALGGSPTMTGSGLGIIVLNSLQIGGPTTTTLTLTTSDQSLDVNGNVIIDSVGTFIASDSASFTLGGDFRNDGTFTGSGGTIVFDSGTDATIEAGQSSFSNVTILKTGALTISEHATTTGTFTLSSSTLFTLSSGQALGVGGTFTNNLGGAATTWAAGASLHLYGGGNYTLNPKTISDSYSRISIGGSTQIRMWNSNGSSYDIGGSASLYSQDHASNDGDLYIFGSYHKTTGSDYWSYTKDFDGVDITGFDRAVSVYIQNGSSVLYTGGELALIGSPAGSTTIQNQGSGTYTFRFGGTASTTWTYYEVADTDASGITFSGTPTVGTLSYGSFTIGPNGASGITVGGTAINQNPAKTFTDNLFATTSGVTTAVNVTATGTSISSWRFTNHRGDIDGEGFNIDPTGDPGYIVWDNSAALISVSGTVYADDGVSTSTVCDGATPNIVLRMAGLTTYTSTCNASTGIYNISGVAYSPGDSFVVYINGESEKAATVSEDPVSSIANMDLYENRVIVRHEGTDSLSIADMAVWDSSDDADIPFTAVDGSPDTLTLPADRKLIVWTGKEFEPNGDVTITGGGGGSAYDGTLELFANALFDATGGESHIIGGSLLAGAGATIDDETSTFTFTSNGSRTIDSNDTSFYNLSVTGNGTFTITNTTLSIGNNLSMSQGSLIFPTGTTTIDGSLLVTGGSLTINGSPLVMTSSSTESIRTGGSPLRRLVINGTGSFTIADTNATVTQDIRIIDGTFTSATGTLTIGSDFVNQDTFTHGTGILRFTSSSTANVTSTSSDLYSVSLAGGGTYLFTEINEALLGSLTIASGTLTVGTGTLSIGGSYINQGIFNHSSGTILFNSSDTGEVVSAGSSTLHHVTFASAGGGWTMNQNATTTGNLSLTTATNFTVSSSTRLRVGGVFTNLVGGGATTWTGSTLVLESGSAYTINSKVAGGDTYNNVHIGSSTELRAWDSAANVTMLDQTSSLYSQDNGGVSGVLAIYGNYVRTTGTDYWSYATDFDGTALGGSSRQATVTIVSGATTTFTGGTLNIIGTTATDTVITNQGSGTYSFSMLGGTINAQYYSISNMNAVGLNLQGTTTITSLIEGNYTLNVNGGVLITLSSTTLNHNAGIVVTGASFATSTGVTGTNVSVVGTTPSAWTFVSHTGTIDGESYDNDGGDACGSIRWDDSACLLTEQSGYRFRNDDGGEGVPNSEWFDTNHTKRKRITVTNNDAQTYIDSVVELPITYDGDMQTDFDDLRFTDSDGTTIISHFRESYTASTDAVVWVKVPTLATSSDAIIYMYYGSSTASDTSATTTFNVMDTFEDGSLSDYAGDTGDFSVVGSNAYERTYRLEAFDQSTSKTDQNMRNMNVTSQQGQTLRWFQYIDTVSGAADETCTHFGIQTGATSYAVCLELFGVDRMSISENAVHRDTSGTVLASTTVSYTTGWYEVEVDWRTNNTIFASLYDDNVLIATTTATDTSYTTGGIGFTLWGYHGGWDIYSARPYLQTEPTVFVGSEQVSGGASWLAALNTIADTVEIGDDVRVRILIENTGLPVLTQNYELEFAAKGVAPSCESVAFGSYVEVPNQSSCGTSDLCMITSSQFTNLASTSDVIGGDGAFAFGQIVEDPSNNTGNVSIQANEFTELEYAFEVTSNSTDTNYCLRVSNEGTDLDSYARVAELEIIYEPEVQSFILNANRDITLTGGSTTTVYATGTIADENGYADLTYATATIYRSGVTESCATDPNNCYRASNSQCTFTNCSGLSCELSCSVDIFYHADPTDIGTYAAETWRAYAQVSDIGGSVGTGSAPSIDLVTLRSLSVDTPIAYGALEVNSDTGSYNPTTTITNIGNDAIDISIEGTNLTDGASSTIPASQQKYATSTFTYSACIFCNLLATTSSNYEVDLTKPTSSSTPVTDQLFWGIAIPYGARGTSHQGVNTFYAIGE